jgi:hypothetical protein
LKEIHKWSKSTNFVQKKNCELDSPKKNLGISVIEMTLEILILTQSWEKKSFFFSKLEMRHFRLTCDFWRKKIGNFLYYLFRQFGWNLFFGSMPAHPSDLHSSIFPRSQFLSIRSRWRKNWDLNWNLSLNNQELINSFKNNVSTCWDLLISISIALSSWVPQGLQSSKFPKSRFVSSRPWSKPKSSPKLETKSQPSRTNWQFQKKRLNMLRLIDLYLDCSQQLSPSGLTKQ